MGMMKNCRYTKEHEWVSTENGVATIGISEYAQDLLGDITFVELPSEGDEVKQFEQVASIESVKAASDIFSPVSGTIVEVNADLEDHPELINESCYEKGWIAKIKISDENELTRLMNADEYETFLGECEE